jgi:hypothetical protein
MRKADLLRDYVFLEKRFENAFPGNLRFCAKQFVQNTQILTVQLPAPCLLGQQTKSIVSQIARPVNTRPDQTPNIMIF